MNFISSEPGGIFYTVNLYIRSHRRSFISPALLYHLNARFLSQRSVLLYLRCDLLIYHLFIWIIFHGKLLQHCHSLLSGFYQMASAKYHYTLHKWCPGFFFDRFMSINSETYLITGTQRINLMSHTCSMKINFSVFLIKIIVDRYCIRITIITIYGKNASAAVLQQSQCFICADLIFFFLIGLNIIFLSLS